MFSLKSSRIPSNEKLLKKAIPYLRFHYSRILRFFRINTWANNIIQNEYNLTENSRVKSPGKDKGLM